MSVTQIIQWSIWGLTVLFGIAVILAAFKLRIAERSLPPWNELKEIESVLPVLREELRQVSEATLAHRQELAKLEGEVGHLRQLNEWQKANPDAPARIQQMMVDLERGKSELTAVQQKLAQDEARLNEVLQEVSRLTQEKTQFAEQTAALRDQLAALHKQKADMEKSMRDLDDQRRQSELRLAKVNDDLQTSENQLKLIRQQLQQFEQEKAAAVRERDQARADRDSAKAELEGLKKSVETYKSLVENLNVQLQKTGVADTDLGKALADLAQPVLRFAFTGRSQLDESTALRNLSDHLLKKALRYPHRFGISHWQSAFPGAAHTSQNHQGVNMCGF